MSFSLFIGYIFSLTNWENTKFGHSHSPSGGMLAFLRLSRSSVVSLATAVPLLVLRRTLKALFRRRNERLRTDVLSKLRSVNECDRVIWRKWLRKEERKTSLPKHAWTCPLHILVTISQAACILKTEEGLRQILVALYVLIVLLLHNCLNK